MIFPPVEVTAAAPVTISPSNTLTPKTSSAPIDDWAVKAIGELETVAREVKENVATVVVIVTDGLAPGIAQSMRAVPSGVDGIFLYNSVLKVDEQVIALKLSFV